MEHGALFPVIFWEAFVSIKGVLFVNVCAPESFEVCFKRRQIEVGAPGRRSPLPYLLHQRKHASAKHSARATGRRFLRVSRIARVRDGVLQATTVLVTAAFLLLLVVSQVAEQPPPRFVRVDTESIQFFQSRLEATAAVARLPAALP